MEFMLRNFKAVSVTKAFKELDPELMMKITATAGILLCFVSPGGVH